MIFLVMFAIQHPILKMICFSIELILRMGIYRTYTIEANPPIQYCTNVIGSSLGEGMGIYRTYTIEANPPIQYCTNVIGSSLGEGDAEDIVVGDEDCNADIKGAALINI
jgi:hypothetical protein